MARGFLAGLTMGAVVSVLGLAAASLLNDHPRGGMTPATPSPTQQDNAEGGPGQAVISVAPGSEFNRDRPDATPVIPRSDDTGTPTSAPAVAGAAGPETAPLPDTTPAGAPGEVASAPLGLAPAAGTGDEPKVAELPGASGDSGLASVPKPELGAATPPGETVPTAPAPPEPVKQAPVEVPSVAPELPAPTDEATPAPSLQSPRGGDTAGSHGAAAQVTSAGATAPGQEVAPSPDATPAPTPSGVATTAPARAGATPVTPEPATPARTAPAEVASASPAPKAPASGAPASNAGLGQASTVAPKPPATETATGAEVTSPGSPSFETPGSTATAGTTRLPRIGVSNGAEQTAPEVASPDETATAADGSADAATQGALDRNALPFEPASDLPLLSVVLIDEGAGGLSPQNVADLPFPVTVALAADAPSSAEVAAAYHAAGTEVILLAPPLARGESAEGLRDKVLGYMSSVPDAIGLADAASGGFQGNRRMLSGVVGALAQDGGGLLLWDRGLNPLRVPRQAGLPSALIFKPVDGHGESASAIGRILDRAALDAGQQGASVIIGHDTAATMKALGNWAKAQLVPTVEFAPLSAILKK